MGTNKIVPDKLLENYNAVKKVAIVGLPNTGKSQVFNFCTDKYTLVANYPLTTVEIKKHNVKWETSFMRLLIRRGFIHFIFIQKRRSLSGT